MATYAKIIYPESQDALVLRIKYLAASRGVKMRYLSDQLNVDAGFFSECNRGKRKMTMQQVERIATLLSVSPEYLLGLSDEKEKPTGAVADGLSDKEIKLVEAFRGLSPEEQDAWMLVLSGKKTPQ